MPLDGPEASLVMLDSDHRDGFFYLPLTPMIYSYIRAHRIMISANYIVASASYLTHPYPPRGKDTNREFSRVWYTLVVWDVTVCNRSDCITQSTLSGFEGQIEKSVPRDHSLTSLGSLVIPDSYPRDGFFCLPHTSMIDSYNPTQVILPRVR